MAAQVAPRVGAWIETFSALTGNKDVSTSHPVWVRGLKHGNGISGECLCNVAPRVGAWIETRLKIFLSVIRSVAPRVGAWIETCYRYSKVSKIRSHPVWVRGLKPE